MIKPAAFTKILLALIISLSCLLSNNISALIFFVFIEIIAIFYNDIFSRALKTVLFISFFAFILYLIQIIFDTQQQLAILSALRMLIMSLSIIILLLTTHTQEITAALVKQCYLPYSYAFMITAVLRFVPDLLSESQIVKEAQTCRGYTPSANPFKRIYSYMTVVKPLVFKAIERSDSMAISLEMRGFSRIQNRTFISETKLKITDYFIIAIFIVINIAAIKLLPN